MKISEVKVSKRLENGKWVIRVKGVTSGFVVHTTDDDSTIEFKFDATRFEPKIQVE